MSGEKEIEVRRMMQQFEHQISEMNSNEISARAGDISKNDFLKLAKAIAVLRARYLNEVLNMARSEADSPSGEQCAKTRNLRIAYEEVMQGFDHLKHALTRGYFNLVDD